MDVFEAIRTILAVRRFTDKPLPEGFAAHIIEAAQLTSSSKNGQPWHFIVVEDRGALQKLGTLARTGPYIAQSQLAIAVAMEPSPFAVSDGSLAIHSMMLAAWAEGVGSNWVGFSNSLKEAAGFLGIPEDYDLIGIVPFGYPENPGGRGKKRRKPLAEIAHRERFGQAFGD